MRPKIQVRQHWKHPYSGYEHEEIWLYDLEDGKSAEHHYNALLKKSKQPMSYTSVGISITHVKEEEGHG